MLFRFPESFYKRIGLYQENSVSISIHLQLILELLGNKWTNQVKPRPGITLQIMKLVRKHDMHPTPNFPTFTYLNQISYSLFGRVPPKLKRFQQLKPR